MFLMLMSCFGNDYFMVIVEKILQLFYLLYIRDLNYLNEYIIDFVMLKIKLSNFLVQNKVIFGFFVVFFIMVNDNRKFS